MGSRDLTQYLLVPGLAFFLGYALVLVISRILPRRLRAENDLQRSELLKSARLDAQVAQETALRRMDEDMQLEREDLEEQWRQVQADLELTEQELAERERAATKEEERVQKISQDTEEIRARVEGVVTELREIQGQKSEQDSELKRELARRAQIDLPNATDQLAVHMIEQRQLECQRILKGLQEDLSTNSYKNAVRMLSRTMSRYAPTFYWPKMVNHVELAEPRHAEPFQDPQNPVFAALRELAEIEVELQASERSPLPLVRFSGGMGTRREAARRTFEKLVAQGPSIFPKVREIYQSCLTPIEREAQDLGRKAVLRLGLKPMHPEIQKLVGSLNWRTSYRQNQYLHTVEVAQLAGILACEVGVDPELAKRVGLLHDIGKCLDYRIEGSHAVISADYADRFGERRIVCDTVMSHHNDLVVETPLADVLKAADTLSGARPGARVNLEEGYNVRLSAIDDVVRSFPETLKSVIMNGGREVHIEVNPKRVTQRELDLLSQAIARKIESDVAFPGQIKVQVTRRFEAVAVA